MHCKYAVLLRVSVRVYDGARACTARFKARQRGAHGHASRHRYLLGEPRSTSAFRKLPLVPLLDIGRRESRRDDAVIEFQAGRTPRKAGIARLS